MDAGNKLKIFLFLVADVAALYAGLFIALLIRYGGNFYTQLLNAQVSAFTIIFIVWIIVFYIAGLYDLRRLRNNIDFVKTLFLCIGVNAALAVLLFYLIPAFGIEPKTTLFIFIVVFAIIEIFWRRFLNRMMAFGEAPNKMLIIGDGVIAADKEDRHRKFPARLCHQGGNGRNDRIRRAAENNRDLTARRGQPHCYFK
jgi:FlaA1/EpsC-like NDP-sugar epimerase